MSLQERKEKKFFKLTKGYFGAEKMYGQLQKTHGKKVCNMHSVTVKQKRNFADCGFNVLTLLHV
jgi:ribosomal protein L20